MTDVRDESEFDDSDSASEDVVMEVGPPIRVTFVIRADKIPVAPWAQGWHVGAIGPDSGLLTLICEHDMDLSPVAQLSAITGILGTFKQAQLDVVWWTIQTRGPLDLEQPDMDTELAKLLDPDYNSSSED